MSDGPLGSGWWRASDGRWYPPETHPDYQAPARPALPPPPSPPPGSRLSQEQFHSGLSRVHRKVPWFRRWWVVGGSVALVLIVIAVLSAGSDSSQDDAKVAAEAELDDATPTTRHLLMEGLPEFMDPRRTIIFEVEGTTDRASVTYTTPDGISQLNLNVPAVSSDEARAGVPGIPTGEWSKGEFLSISAQNQRGSGTITCRISTGEGEVLSEVSSSGAYVIASCDATVP